MNIKTIRVGFITVWFLSCHPTNGIDAIKGSTVA